MRLIEDVIEIIGLIVCDYLIVFIMTLFNKMTENGTFKYVMNGLAVMLIITSIVMIITLIRGYTRD